MLYFCLDVVLFIDVVVVGGGGGGALFLAEETSLDNLPDFVAAGRKRSSVRLTFIIQNILIVFFSVISFVSLT